MYTIKDLYDLDHTLAKDYLSQFTYPWEALKGIKDLIIALGEKLGDDYEERAPQVWVHKTAKVFGSLHHRSQHRGASVRIYPRIGSGRR